ncbi:type II toxin-antitoxin system VapC family toxin [Flavobacteriaceae bacterium]|nr:type II toxin-antitoxin system VapC family toxin [Flavobacteriaceae bacterium]
MNGNKLFVDTNIVLYLLNGDQTLAELLDQKQIYLSFVTELELLAFQGITAKEESLIKAFIQQCKVISINDQIKYETIQIRKIYKTKLPDSIIMATALYLDLPLITSDIDFKKVVELNLIHYTQ